MARQPCSKIWSRALLPFKMFPVTVEQFHGNQQHEKMPNLVVFLCSLFRFPVHKGRIHTRLNFCREFSGEPGIFYLKNSEIRRQKPSNNISYSHPFLGNFSIKLKSYLKINSIFSRARVHQETFTHFCSTAPLSC